MPDAASPQPPRDWHDRVSSWTDSLFLSLPSLLWKCIVLRLGFVSAIQTRSCTEPAAFDRRGRDDSGPPGTAESTTRGAHSALPPARLICQPSAIRVVASSLFVRITTTTCYSHPPLR